MGERERVRREMALAERKIRAGQLAEKIEDHSRKMMELARELREEIERHEEQRPN